MTGDVNFSNATGTAAEIDYDATVIGPVESIDTTLKHLIVLGQTVFTNADTIFDSGIDPDTFAGLSLGDNVQISGFRNDAGEIIATLVAPDTTSTTVQLIGTVSGLDSVNMLFSMDRLTIDYRSAALIDLPGGAPVNGQQVMVRGTLASGVLIVSEITSVTNVITTPGERALLSGLVTRFSSSSDFDLNGLPVTTDTDTQFFDGVADDLEANVEITVDGEVATAGDTVSANEIYFDGLVNPRTTLTFDFDNFTDISVSGFLKLTVTKGADFSVEVLANSDNVDEVQVTQTGAKVSIEESPGNSAFHMRDVFVTMPVLNRIDVVEDSLANVTLRNFDQVQMEVNVDGVSLLRGEALSIDNLTAAVSGVSALHFGGISPINSANIDINGVSQAILNMDANATITGTVQTGQGTGHSILYYYGTNVTNNVTTDSLSEVIRLGETKL